MRKELYLSISEFSRISDVNRKKLIFYDKIGLFKPAMVKPNGYRYYAHWQVETITVISLLSDLGMSLDEIKRYLNQYGPNTALRVLREQDELLTQRIEKLRSSQSMLRTRISMMEKALAAPEDIFQVVEREKLPIYQSDGFRCDADKIPDEQWVSFYNACEQNHIPFCYPVGYIVRQEDLLRGAYSIISYLFSRAENTAAANSVMPAGRYLVGYGNFHYGDAAELYRQMCAYAERHHLMLGGNAYEEYLLDELIADRPDGFKVRVSIKLQT